MSYFRAYKPANQLRNGDISTYQRYNMSETRDIDRSLLYSKLAEQLQQSRALKYSILSHYDNSKYSVMNHASKAQIFAFECLAVFLFTYGYSSAVSAYEVDAQAASSSLMAIFLAAPLSGANLSPMITLSNCLKKQNRYKWDRFLGYTVGQLVGAVAGVFFSELMGRSLLPELTFKQGSIDIFRVISNEAMGVFILILFLLLLSNPNTTFIESQLTGYLSIAVFYFIARSFAPFAGLAINSAMTLAVAIQYATKGKWDSLENCWAWLLGDLVGCLLATYFYTFVYEPIVVQLREIKRKSENFESVTEEEDLSSKSILQGDKHK